MIISILAAVFAFGFGLMLGRLWRDRVRQALEDDAFDMACEIGELRAENQQLGGSRPLRARLQAEMEEPESDE